MLMAITFIGVTGFQTSNEFVNLAHCLYAVSRCREPFRQGTPRRCRHKPFEQSLELRTQIQFLTLLL